MQDQRQIIGNSATHLRTSTGELEKAAVYSVQIWRLTPSWIFSTGGDIPRIRKAIIDVGSPVPIGTGADL